jgi:hypothetical protein
MPLIKEQLETFEELAPFVKMTVAPNGVTVGDLAFVSSQTVWSSALQTITSANQVPGDMTLDLFQAAIGDTGQGYTTSLTRGETSWLDSAGRLPANQVFVGVECAFQAYLRSTQSTTSAATITTIRNVSALQAIGQALTWEVTVGDGITRTLGSIGAYGGLAGISAAIPLVGSGAVTANVGAFSNATNLNGAQGVFLGDSCSSGVRLRVPLVFPPNINVRIRVRNGNAFNVATFNNGASPAVAQDTLPTSQFLCVKQFIRGYLCTMPV